MTSHAIRVAMSTPWSAKAMGLIKDQYASVGAAARTVLPEANSILGQAAARGLEVSALAARVLALREHGLGLESLTAFVDREPLWKVLQSVFAVLALESQPVDPHL